MTEAKKEAKRLGRVTIGVFAMMIVAFGVGFLVGYFALRSEAVQDKRNLVNGTDRFTADDLVDLLNVANIEANVRYFSSQPHWAGSKRQFELANDIRMKWAKYGFAVDMPEYDVLLTVPDENNPDYIEIVNNKGTTLFNYSLSSKVKADPGDNKTWTIPRYYFYSASGAVQGGLIYANFGRQKDFERLKQLNVTSCNGSIVMVKRDPTYSITAPEQIENAFRCNASGLLVFTTPHINDTLGWGTNDTYPNNIWLPKDSPIADFVRHTIGDPLTPELPSIKGTYRLSEKESKIPMKIPIQLIEYSVALDLLSRLKGSKVPQEWKPQWDQNKDYSVGPEFSQDETLRLVVTTTTRRKTIYNVIGTVYGWDEPDHWVLLGNHRDAISFGAADAVSGTAAMMELSRAVGELLAKGWKPRRSIRFCSWAAEEQGLVGSTEWVEENVDILRERAVAYINIDWLVYGNHSLKCNGNPMFTDLIFSLTKLVKDPHYPAQTMYSTWLKRRPSNASDANTVPEFLTSGRGTDYQSFYEFAGVPALDLQYRPKRTVIRQMSYHTPYDTYHMAKLFDVGFKLHLAQTQLASRIIFNFTEAVILPFNLTYLSISLEKSLRKTENYYTEILRHKNITLTHLREEANLLEKKIKEFESWKDICSTLKGKEQLRFIQMINRRIVALNKMFLSRTTYNRSPSIRNVLHGISKHTSRPWNKTLPAIADAIEDARHSGTWSMVKHWISVTNHCIVQAGKMLMIPFGGLN